MQTNHVLEKIRAGTPTIGSFVGLGSPQVTELLAHAGFDWLLLETEHSAVDLPQIEHMLMAMKGTNAVPFVRVPAADPVWIQRSLDAGAMGILVPMIRTASELEAVVRATRYPPAGTRGFGPLRASHYAQDYEDYHARANENVALGMILETKEAVDGLEEICAVAGLDFLFLGLFDLCISYGLNPHKMPHPEIDVATQRALAVGKDRGVAVGAGASTPDDLRSRQAEGFTILAYGPDYIMLTAAARAGLEAFQR